MLSFFLAGAASIIAPCPGETTVEVNACLEARLKDRDAVLNRYYHAALTRIAKESRPNTAEGFMQAQRSWKDYRDRECSSLAYFWVGGTIAASKELDCRILLTELRTYAIWRDWLTYPDGTPPVLPRPEIESATSER